MKLKDKQKRNNDQEEKLRKVGEKKMKNRN